MPNKYAVIIAVENYQDSNITSVVYAENDANEFAGSLVQHGFNDKNAVLLLSNQATKTKIESVFRSHFSCAEENDTLLIFYAGHGFSLNANNYITCHDTVHSDLTATSIELQSLFSSIRNCKCNKVILLLDSCHSGLPIDQSMRSLISKMTDQEFKAFCKESSYNIVFASSDSDEYSYSNSQLKHGVWTHHVIQAFNGQAIEALERGKYLTTSSLQNYLSAEIPRTMRKLFTGVRKQTPKAWGNVSREAVLADFSEIFAKKQISSTSILSNMKRASLYGHDFGPVRSLSGFKKGYTVPDSINDWTCNFVKKTGNSEVVEIKDSLFQKLKDGFGYKRRDISINCYTGSARILTPDFTVNIDMDIDHKDPSQYDIQLEVTDIKDFRAIESKTFSNVFFNHFDRIVFEVKETPDLEQIVDTIEGLDDEVISVEYPPDVSYCEVTIAGLDGILLIESGQVSFVKTRKERVENLLRGCRELPTLLAENNIVGLLPAENNKLETKK